MTEALNEAQSELYRDDSFLHDDVRRKLIPRLLAYDINHPDAEHLRPHQIEAVQGFFVTARDVVSGRMPNEGMSLLHPTGSGKTVDIAEIARMLCAERPRLEPVNILMLVPGYQILRQTIGDEEDEGVIRTYAPGVTVGEYSGQKKTTDARVTVMNYQSLKGAVKRGDIDLINPGLIVCDEGHHVIDGVWAQDVASISRGRLLMATTSTPAYSHNRDIRNLFPHVIAQKTLREGIEEGILSELRGFLYRGSDLTLSAGSSDYSQESVFSALANSRDNYLAAALCAGEVSQGRRGVVRCAPGFDRAHSKIMAKILANTPVNSPEGKRPIRAVSVDGEMDKDVLKKIIGQYNNGQIDVLTYTKLLLEGWDSPLTDFGVMLNPTKSSVLEEQSIGRLVRPMHGKVATLHEIVYEITGDRRQITHLDVLQADRMQQGRRYGAPVASNSPKTSERKDTKRVFFDIDSFVVNSGLIAAFSDEKSPSAVQETQINWEQEGIPYDWRTAHIIARILGENRQKVMAALQAIEAPSRTISANGTDHTFYSPDAISMVAPSFGIGPLPEGENAPMTLDDLTEYVRNSSQYKRMLPGTVHKIMQKSGVRPKRYLIAGNRVVEAYDYEDRDLPAVNYGVNKRPAVAAGREVSNDSQAKILFQWLEQALVNPNSADSQWRRQQIMLAQRCLVQAIKERDVLEADTRQLAELDRDITANSIQPTPVMQKLMHGKKIEFNALLALAKQAQDTFSKVVRS